MAKQRTKGPPGGTGTGTRQATVEPTSATLAPGRAGRKEWYGGTLVVYILLGGAAGAAYGLLNAPSRGADSRAGLAGLWQDALELIAEGISEADNRVRSRLAGEEPLVAAGDGATTFG